MNILITGGCGYKGSVLVPKLLAAGHKITVIDSEWFGNNLPRHPNLEVIRGDIRLGLPILHGIDCIIHLASVANDPSANLNPTLTWEVSALATARLADAAVRSGVKQFIYASSASVYGVKSEPRVTEDLTCESITPYNSSKAVAERVLLSYADRTAVQIVRPATVCGLSPRMRLCLAVNLLTWQALTRGKITVLGGDQYRPNIHIDDITDLYCWLIEHPEVTGVYNAGAENLTISEIAGLISEATGAQIEVRESNDPRSYRLDSQKLANAGWRPSKCVRDAIHEIVEAHASKKLVEREDMSNVNWMRSQGFK